MATHSSTLAWEIPWMEEPGRLHSVESQSRTRLSDFTFTFTFNMYSVKMCSIKRAQKGQLKLLTSSNLLIINAVFKMVQVEFQKITTVRSYLKKILILQEKKKKVYIASLISFVIFQKINLKYVLKCPLDLQRTNCNIFFGNYMIKSKF